MISANLDVIWGIRIRSIRQNNGGEAVRKKLKRTVILAAIGVVLATNFVRAEESNQCVSLVKDEPFRTTTATASIFANLGNRKGSLRYEIDALFDAAKAAVEDESFAAPKDLCPSHCNGSPKAFFVFRAAPQKYLEDYRGKEKCAALLRQTKQEPFIYADKKFDSLNSFKDWFNEFIQGNGAEGEDLYSRCDGSCSPRFHLTLSGKDGVFNVDSSIICGHARDKDDNMYQISSSFRWTCEDAN